MTTIVSNVILLKVYIHIGLLIITYYLQKIIHVRLKNNDINNKRGKVGSTSGCQTT